MNEIKFTYFKSITELNKWYNGGESVEIISINYNMEKDVHFCYYRLKF